MIGDQESLTKDSLAFTIGNAGKEVRAGIVYKLFHGLEVFPKGFETGVPGGRVGRGVTFRPVAFGKLRRDVLRISTELQNIKLSQAHVLHESPGRMWHAGRLDAAQLGRKTGYGFVEAQMRPA